MDDSMALKIKGMLKEIKESSFKPECVKYISDQQAMGILVSRYFDYDGLLILQTASSGLTDANFHEESRKIDTIIQDIYALDSIEG